MLLAGDIGGTKTLLGLFEPAVTRPRAVTVRTFATLEFAALPEMIEIFLRDANAAAASVEVACFGVAGPVIDEVVDVTNVPWRVDGRQVAKAFRLRRVALLNDLQAMACAVPALEGAEVHVLQSGR